MSKYLGMKYNLSDAVHKVLDQGDARIATVKEQADWVVGHFNGYEGNQAYRFPLTKSSNDTAYMITKDIDLPPLWGNEALTIIVPKGVHVSHKGLGDNRLLYMDGFQMEAAPWADIKLGPALLHELAQNRNLWAEDFIYAEASAASPKKTAFNGAANVEKTLGLVGEANHGAPVFAVLRP